MNAKRLPLGILLWAIGAIPPGAVAVDPKPPTVRQGPDIRGSAVEPGGGTIEAGRRGRSADVCTGSDCDECGTALAIGEGVWTSTTVGNSGIGTGDDTSCPPALPNTPIDEVDEWYRYTPTCTGTATASLCGSSYDTTLAVFDGCVSDVPGNGIVCDDDFCGIQSVVSWPVTSGTPYYVRVSGYLGATGSYSLKLTCTGPADPCGSDNVNSCCDCYEFI